MAEAIKEDIVKILRENENPLSVKEISLLLQKEKGGSVCPSTVRSSLLHNSAKDGSCIVRVSRGQYCYGFVGRDDRDVWTWRSQTVVNDDCLHWLREQPPSSIHAIVTDPPYGVVEYREDQQAKLRSGRGGVWRQPPSFDGHRRSPLPRFTTLNGSDKEDIFAFFEALSVELLRVAVPGANLIMASNPLVVHIVSSALEKGGWEPRGQLIRLVQTMRGGDRPKGHEAEYSMVSVMPRSQWEPWIVMRKPLDGTVARNLVKWGTGGFRRISEDSPFGDVIKSSPTSRKEKQIAPHPSLKPQKLMRDLVSASLPLGRGVLLDPFCGGGSTVAAAEASGITSIGIERDKYYFDLAADAIPKLARL
uniref:Methyltransferase n=1 Tax=Muribaculaceae bacterium Z82 TaxID=2304548 RepID=A0A7C9JR15_9BACT